MRDCSRHGEQGIASSVTVDEGCAYGEMNGLRRAALCSLYGDAMEGDLRMGRRYRIGGLVGRIDDSAYGGRVMRLSGVWHHVPCGEADVCRQETRRIGCRSRRTLAGVPTALVDFGVHNLEMGVYFRSCVLRILEIAPPNSIKRRLGGVIAGSVDAQLGK